mmetsp:Transcript_25479/g.57772  ORF Transcript_25479/g.57772 Transcript_25479/m.57772 type:complete len:251 (+) Transcript_25479:742-1494(+)
MNFSGPSTSCNSQMPSAGRSQSSVLQRPIRSTRFSGSFAPSSNRLHVIPDFVFGSRCVAAPGRFARKAMPSASAATWSRLASSQGGGGVQQMLQSLGGNLSISRNSSTVVRAAHETVSSRSGRCAVRRRWRRPFMAPLPLLLPRREVAPALPSAQRRLPKASRSDTSTVSKRLQMRDASGSTSKASTSSCSTLRSGIEFEVLAPCWMCKQKPQLSRNSATLSAPFRFCSWVIKAKSSPMLTSSYQFSNPI